MSDVLSSLRAWVKVVPREIAQAVINKRVKNE